MVSVFLSQEDDGGCVKNAGGFLHKLPALRLPMGCQTSEFLSGVLDTSELKVRRLTVCLPVLLLAIFFEPGALLLAQQDNDTLYIGARTRYATCPCPGNPGWGGGVMVVSEGLAIC